MQLTRWIMVLLLMIPVINYPNPFSPKGGEITTFECTPAQTSEAFICIYDMSARLVRKIDFDLKGGSVNRTSWDGYGNNNQLAGSSIYLYHLMDKSGRRIGKGKIWVINR